MSGIKSDRPELSKVLKVLAAGDVLMVTRLDRLGRSVRDLLNIIDAITKVGASFRSLLDPWADTSSPHGKLVLTMLAGVSEFEHHLISVRTSEGRARAVARGVKLGPKRKLSPAQVDLAKDLRTAAWSCNEIAAVLKVSNPTVRRALRKRRAA
jgi:DNA invertase Pin-like site-specific DNA recombinase